MRAYIQVTFPIKTLINTHYFRRKVQTIPNQLIGHQIHMNSGTLCFIFSWQYLRFILLILPIHFKQDGQQAPRFLLRASDAVTAPADDLTNQRELRPRNHMQTHGASGPSQVKKKGEGQRQQQIHLR